MTDIKASQRLISALGDPFCYPHAAKSVQVVETHISWVLLAGRFAYKIKKPVDLGFLDFTELSSRQFFCQEEIRLNRRLAPNLYLDVIPIGGTPEHPLWDKLPAIEYAVRMRRFASNKLLDRMLTQNRITPQHINDLAASLALFHASLPTTTPCSGYGSPQAILFPARQNFTQLEQLLHGDDLAMLLNLRDACEREFVACQPVFEQRWLTGHIRECHADLHLGNIMLWRDQPTPFDGIEFSAELRWIDVMNEIAFLVMDLLHHDRPDLAWRSLNAYLEISGDYAGLGVLRFYLCYRALVRAKICAIQADKESCRSYLELAGDCLARHYPALIMSHGLPGCGKSTITQLALERLQAIRLRSDVERKRLFGLTADGSSHEVIPGGIYGTDANRQTYGRLLDLAQQLLEMGFTVIIDAAFLKHEEREQFRALAGELQVPCAILSVRARISTLRQRIRQRLQHGKDASEANIAVLDALRLTREPLQADELYSTVDFLNERDIAAIAADQTAWRKLNGLLKQPIA